jgi:hypothetical protein
MCGMLPGGATVPGLALIEVLPLVWQIDIVCVLWQVGRASATGAVNSATADTPAMNNAELFRAVICPRPFHCTQAAA